MAETEVYWISGSPPCWSMLLGLEVKGIAYKSHRLDNAKKEQKSDAFLKVNPRGQVPALRAGDLVVRETLAILAYLERAYPEPRLFGNDARHSALIWQMACECDSFLRDPVGAISRPLFRGKAEAFRDEIIAAAGIVRDELRSLEDRLQNSPYLTGEAISTADVIHYPVIMQLARAAGKEEAHALNLGLMPLEETFPCIVAWMTRMEEIPGYERTYPPHWRKN